MVPTNGEFLPDPPNSLYSTPSFANKFRDSPHRTPDDLVASSPILRESTYPDKSIEREFPEASLSPSSRRSQDPDASTWTDDLVDEQEQDVLDSANGHTQEEGGTNSHRNGNEGSGNSSTSRHRSRGSIDIYKYSELSQTAEQIMDHARKKLSALEGNLKGARHSLLSPSLVSPRMPELSKYSGAGRHQSNLSAEEEERLRARGPRIRFGLPRQPQAGTNNSTQRTPKGDLQAAGHSRVYSETSVPTGLGMSIKGSRVLEQGQVTLDPLQRSPQNSEKQETKSPPSVGELSSYSTPSPSNRRVSALASYQASPSTRDLRGKAEELKGRLSFIQERVREDAVRRTSFQSTKSPSDGDEGVSVGEMASPEQTIEEQDELKDQFNHVKDSRADYNPPKTEDYSTDEGPADDYSTDGSSNHVRSASQQLKGVLKYPEAKKTIPQRQSDSRAEWHRVLSENRHDLETGSLSPTEEDSDEGEFDFRSVLEHQLEEDEFAMQGPHEERADAFDYEHFILHSALGNYAAGRPPSSSSGSSASTTRGPAQNEFVDAEQVNSPFETADEGQGSDSGSDGADWDEINSSWPVPPISGHHSRSTSDVDGSNSTAFITQAPTIFGIHNGVGGGNGSHRPASIILAALLASNGAENPLGETDSVLVRSIVEKLGKICVQLSNVGVHESEADALRSKLQQVSAVLGGESLDPGAVNGEAEAEAEAQARATDSVQNEDDKATVDIADDAKVDNDDAAAAAAEAGNANVASP